MFLVICLLPCFAAAELSADDRAVMMEQTETLAALMAECAADAGYTKLYLGSDAEARDLVRKIGTTDWKEHHGGTVYLLKEGAIEAFLSASGVSLSDFSPAVADKVRQAVAGSIPAAVAGQAGIAFTAAVSVLRTGSVFQAEASFPEYSLVFLNYSKNYSALCSFVKNAENIVSASLIPVPADSESMLKRVMGLRNLFTKNDSLYEEYPITDKK